VAVDKLPSGRWRARYRGPDGKFRTSTHRLKSEAEQWQREQLSARHRGGWVDPHHEAGTLQAWVDQWSQARGLRLRSSTIARDEIYLRTHVLPAFGQMPLGKIAQQDVQQWVLDLVGTGLAPATVGKTYQLLSSALTAAVRAGRLRVSPCQGVSVPTVERQEMRFLTQGQVGALVQVMPPPWRALVLVAAYGGLRIGELAALRRHRVDLTRGTVTVVETLSEVRGQLVIAPPKTGAGRRTVTLPRPVVAALREHVAQYAAPGEDGYVFPTSQGHPLRVPAWRQRVWRPATVAAGLDGLRVHDLRHTAVALWIDSGASLLQVKQRAGHASSTFTLDRYGHLYPNNDEALLAGLDAGFVAPAASAAVLPLRLARDVVG